MDKYAEAFAVFGLTKEADQNVTSKAYKKLALKHHPDRNPGDYHESTKKFQEIGKAWETCQEYYARKNRPSGFDSGSIFTFSRDDDVPLDPEEEAAFFQFLFQEIFRGQYSRTRARQYRNARAGAAGAGVYAFTESFAQSQQRQQNHHKTQQKEHEEYLERVREFELELEAEAAEERRKAKAKAAEASRLMAARADAFRAARTGDISLIRRLLSQFAFDVNEPEKSKKKSGKPDRMLHVAAQSSGGDMIKFLLEKGADVEALDGEDLTAFHLAVRAGNVPAAKVLLTHKDVHPSRAAKNGQTPLQLAIKSKNLDMISLVVKDATVHDVRRCWDMNDVSDAVREILKTKRGFLESLNSEPVQAKPLKGAQRKVTEARAQREKAARIAEEERRAEINRQKKLEKEESRRIREAEEQERRRKAEEEQAMQRWSRNQEQIRRRAEEEARQAAEEKRKKEIESRHLVEQRAAEERRLAEQEKMRAEQEQRKQRMEQEMRQKATERQAEERRAQAQRKQRRLAEESARRAQELQRKDAERQRKLEEEERRQQEKEQQERAEQLRLREEADQRRLAAGAQKQQQRAEQRRKGGVAASHQPREHTLAPHPSEPADKLSRKSKSKRYTPHEMPQNLTEEQKIRWEVREARRAAQSARDRARAAELKLASSVQQQQHDPALFQPSPIQQGWTLQPEAIQTGPTVDDLFDPPRRKKQTASASDDSGIVITDSPEPPALQIKPTSAYRGRGRGRGRGGRGRGRGRAYFRGAE